MKIKLFATLKETAGSGSIEMDVQETMTVAALVEQIGRQFPALKPGLTVSVVSVNRDFADMSTLVGAADEVAFFPPVSGG